MARAAENVVAFYDKRDTCEQWIKEGKGARPVRVTLLARLRRTSAIWRKAVIADRDGDVWKTRFSASITIQDRRRTSLKIWQRFGEIGSRAANERGPCF